ncbi:MAG TPA: hypothetical protein VGG33_18755 [Polyangia bacterium]
MKRPTLWLSLFCGLWLAGCERPADEPIDPGPPSVSDGPKCTVSLDGAAMRNLDQCTAIATTANGAPHLYLELYPDREPYDVERYASIVLPAGEWTTGWHGTAVAGRVELKFGDGRRYALSPDGDGRFPIDLDITSAERAEDGDHHYVKGELKLTLRGVSGATGLVEFKVVID